jgi:hypothetical protein
MRVFVLNSFIDSHLDSLQPIPVDLKLLLVLVLLSMQFLVQGVYFLLLEAKFL